MEIVHAGTVKQLLTVWGIWLVVMTGANLATPLYGVYAARFGFSSFVLTAIFAVYAVVLFPTLLLFGRLSDRFGRRPVLLAGLLVACAALAVFAFARGTAWLFAARALQGLAVGLISGAATAALVELDPGPGEQRPALLAGLAQALGSGLGPALAGVLVAWAPAPRHLSFLVALSLTVAAAITLARSPEPGVRGGEPWRAQWPRVPPELRRAFTRVSLTAASLWGAMALLLSIVPKYAQELLGTRSPAALGAVAALAFAASCAAQIVSQRRGWTSRRAQGAGLALLVAGLLTLVLTSKVHSLALLFAGSVVTGAGHGVGVLGAQDELNAIAPPDRRGEVTSAFIGCIYLAVATAVIVSGLLDRWLALSSAVASVAITLAAVASATAAWQVSGGRASAARDGSPRERHPRRGRPS